MTNVSQNKAEQKEWLDTNPEFLGFWDKCKSQIKGAASKETKLLDDILIDYKDGIEHAKSEITRFKNFLRTIPVIVAIGLCVKGLIADEFWSEHSLPKLIKLQSKGLIPIKDSSGNLVTLEYFIKNGHQEILENIRCVNEWTTLEKEDIVKCYLQFSHNLKLQTLDIIPQGIDPDIERTRFKTVKYEEFIEFAQHLSERDSLIAKTLYFGAPSLDDVISLKRDQIKKSDFSIKFEKKSVFFPKHLIQDILSFKNAEEGKLLFTNLRGTEVERAHLNQSFARACEKMSKKIKIRPGSLLKVDNESIGEFI